MKCRFYLLDLSEGEWEKKPCVRLWGVDEHGQRVMVIATQILPYFYFLPRIGIDLDSIRDRLLDKKSRFAEIVEVARELISQGWRITLGDKVAYVIVKGPGKLFQKAKPYNQVKPEEVDIEYYLENQVKPAAMRILERFGVKEEQLLA